MGIAIEKKLTEATAKITNLEKQVNVNVRNSEEMERKILIKEIEIQNKEQEMLEKTKGLLKKEEYIKALKIELNRRDEKAEVLNEEIKMHKNKTDNQIKKFNTFEGQMSEVITASNILTKIKITIDLKGFLSDKEFEQLVQEGNE